MHQVEGGNMTRETEEGRESLRQTAEQLKQTGGEAKRGEEQKSVWDQVLLAELPEALHILARLIEAVSVFVFSACELPSDYRETAVHPLSPGLSLMWLCIEWQPRQTLSARSGSGCSPTKPSRLFQRSFHFTNCHSFTYWLIKQIRQENYNDQEIFIKSFFLFLLSVLVSQSCSSTCIYKEIAFL